MEFWLNLMQSVKNNQYSKKNLKLNMQQKF